MPEPTTLPTAPAPAVASAPDLSRDPLAAMEATIKASMPASETPTAPAAEPTKTPTGERQRDPVTGKFVAAEQVPQTSQTPASEVTVGSDTPVPETVAEPEPVIIPEGFVEAKTLPIERTQGFKVRDSEGEIVPPDFIWQINTTAGVRDLSTDKLVSYAQMGVYNHEREQRAQQATQDAQQTRTQLQQALTYAQQLEAKYDALMQSDDAYLTARAQHEALNTPEARIERERQGRRAAEEQVQIVQVQAAGNQFFTGQIKPAVETIEKALPTVTADEIGARLFLLTENLRVQTAAGPLYPTGSYQRIQDALLNEVVPWAQQLHESREISNKATAAQTKQAQKEADAARVRAQKARTQASTATRALGTGTQPAGGSGRPQPAAVRTNKDAEAAVFNATMAAMRSG